MNMRRLLIVTFIVGSLAGGTGTGWADHAGPHFQPRDSVQASLYQAATHVDEAWEAFHQSALGGTLVSPALQLKIERALSESRLLLGKARAASAIGDDRVVFEITERIGRLARRIKEDSRRTKP